MIMEADKPQDLQDESQAGDPIEPMVKYLSKGQQA